MRGRPALREPGGRWSMQQVHRAAGVTLAVARTAARRGMIDGDRLREEDVVVLRVAAALLGAPRPAGLTRPPATEGVSERDQDALDRSRTIAAAGSTARGRTLLVYPTEVVEVSDVLGMMNALAARPTEAVLVLPAGQWAAELPSHAAMERAG